jgi:hypothetical protein
MSWKIWPAILCRPASILPRPPAGLPKGTATLSWNIRDNQLFLSNASETCLWRIVISPIIPQDSPSCYDSAMRNLVVLFILLIATLARLVGPGGVRSLVAESLLPGRAMGVGPFVPKANIGAKAYRRICRAPWGVCLNVPSGIFVP